MFVSRLQAAQLEVKSIRARDLRVATQVSSGTDLERLFRSSRAPAHICLHIVSTARPIDRTKKPARVYSMPHTGEVLLSENSKCLTRCLNLLVFAALKPHLMAMLSNLASSDFWLLEGIVLLFEYVDVQGDRSVSDEARVVMISVWKKHSLSLPYMFTLAAIRGQQFGIPLSCESCDQHVQRSVSLVHAWDQKSFFQMCENTGV